MVENDGGDLAALAATGAVAQHPAAPETHWRGQGFAVAGGIRIRFKTGACCVSVIGGLRDAIAVIAVVIFIVGNTRDGLPALADAIERGKMVAVGLTGEDDAF